MKVGDSVVIRDRYWLTQSGREGLRDAGTCRCEVRLVGLIFECPACGTVYGTLRENSDRGAGGRAKPD